MSRGNYSQTFTDIYSTLKIQLARFNLAIKFNIGEPEIEDCTVVLHNLAAVCALQQALHEEDDWQSNTGAS